MSGNNLVLIWCQDRTFVGAMIGPLCTADFSCFVCFSIAIRSGNHADFTDCNLCMAEDILD
jgi:hypothetical protein